jgi:hypothetical protein
MKNIVSIVSLFVSALSFSQDALAYCARGFCEGDGVYLLAPPMLGRVRNIDPRRQTFAVEYQDLRGDRRVGILGAREVDNSLRSRYGCTSGRQDYSFCVGEQVLIAGSNEYGVVEAVGTYYDDVVVRRQYDRYPDTYWYGPTRGNVIKLDKRRRRVTSQAD